jgi:hypothetical protein
MEEAVAAVVPRPQEDGLLARRLAVTVTPAAIPVRFAYVPRFDKEKAVLKKNQSTAPEPLVPAKQNNSQSTAPARRGHIDLLLMFDLPPRLLQSK